MKFNWSLLLLITATSHELGVSPWHHLLLPKDSVETSKTNSCYLPSQKWFGQWNGQLNSHMGKVQLHSKERFTDLFPANSPNFCERTPRCPQANKKISPPCLGSAPAHIIHVQSIWRHLKSCLEASRLWPFWCLEMWWTVSAHSLAKDLWFKTHYSRWANCA